jgi:hypothetical protein
MFRRSHERVVAELEHSRAGEALDHVGSVETEVLRLEMARLNPALGIMATTLNPRSSHGGMRAAE